MLYPLNFAFAGRGLGFLFRFLKHCFLEISVFVCFEGEGTIKNIEVLKYIEDWLSS